MLNKDEIRNMDANSLKKELNDLKKELFNLRMGEEVKDYSQFKKLRKNIARCLTFLKEKENK